MISEGTRETVTAKVTERYPNGDTWVHYFPSREAAERAVTANKEWHPARTYEIEDIA